MKINIYIFNGIKNNELVLLSDYYLKLVSKYAQVRAIKLKDKSEVRIKWSVLEKYFGSGFNIILNQNGKEYTTVDFANYMEKLKLSHSSINFYIGNAYGFEKDVLDKASMTLSLSQMTLSHEFAYVILLEQLFRCMNLNAGGKYHK